MLIYKFNTNKNEVSEGKVWTSKFFRRYLPPIRKIILKEFFQQYNLPDIEREREIKFSFFNLIPIIDIVLGYIFIHFLYNTIRYPLVNIFNKNN